MREDIESAFRALDAKGQGSFTGMRVPGQVKKAFQQLGEALPNERVLALAVGNDPGPTVGEQRQMGAASNLGAIAAMSKSIRLLVLTENNLHELQAAGRLSGGAVNGVRTPLLNVTDVRTRIDRSMGGIGPRLRHLMFDHMRGALLETEDILIGTDSELQVFAERFTAQLVAVHQAAEAAETARLRPPPPPPPTSVADELQKLAQLRDSGVLSPAEFDAQKTRLLSK